MSPGGVQIAGYDCGFIGGCCFLAEPDLLCFFGDLGRHPEGKEIRDFCKIYGISVRSLFSGPVSYTHLAYLKYHYPKEYFAALLTSILDNTDKVVEYIHQIQKMGIRLLPPHVNESMEGFTATDEGIRFGLLAIKNVGRGLSGAMLQSREENGPFKDFIDFCERMFGRELNRRTLENLIKSGALDRLEMCIRDSQCAAHAGRDRLPRGADRQRRLPAVRRPDHRKDRPHL